jgi:hypothetical protein
MVNNITTADTITNIRRRLTTARTKPVFDSPGAGSKIFTKKMETTTEIQNPKTTLQKSPLVIAAP